MSKNTYHAICLEVVHLLREERKRLKISKYVMAERSGLSEQAIGYIERGLRQPYLETAVRMARALNVELGDVLNQASQSLSRPRPAAKNSNPRDKSSGRRETQAGPT